MTKQKGRRIRFLEMKGLIAISRGNYLLDLAGRMSRGLSERCAEAEILTERGCANVIGMLRMTANTRRKPRKDCDENHNGTAAH